MTELTAYDVNTWWEHTRPKCECGDRWIDASMNRVDGRYWCHYCAAEAFPIQGPPEPPEGARQLTLRL